MKRLVILLLATALGASLLAGTASSRAAAPSANAGAEGNIVQTAVAAGQFKTLAKLLKRAGYRIVGRNVHVPMGEADLVCVAPDRRTVVVVEVKSRRVGEGQPGRVQPAPEMSVEVRPKTRSFTPSFNSRS